LIGAFPNEYLLLNTIESSNNYEEAVKKLSDLPVIASSYYIIAGN
jgi:hypothetical protein